MAKPEMVPKSRLMRSRLIATFARFLISGGLNTLATLIIYWSLLHVVSFQIAYAISFAIGIAANYLMGTKFVFKTRHSHGKMLAFPLVYLASYLAGALVLRIVVGQYGLDMRLAPLIAICITLPLTFVLSKWILDRN